MYDGAFTYYEQGGFINGAAAKKAFTLSKLCSATLAAVWAQSDLDRDARLNRVEFRLALHLVVHVLRAGEQFDSREKPLLPRVPRSLVDTLREEEAMPGTPPVEDPFAAALAFSAAAASAAATRGVSTVGVEDPFAATAPAAACAGGVVRRKGEARGLVSEGSIQGARRRRAVGVAAGAPRPAQQHARDAQPRDRLRRRQPRRRRRRRGGAVAEPAARSTARSHSFRKDPFKEGRGDDAPEPSASLQALDQRSSMLAMLARATEYDDDDDDDGGEEEAAADEPRWVPAAAGTDTAEPDDDDAQLRPRRRRRWRR